MQEALDQLVARAAGQAELPLAHGISLAPAWTSRWT
jgi:hypothetical protein